MPTQGKIESFFAKQLLIRGSRQTAFTPFADSLQTGLLTDALNASQYFPEAALAEIQQKKLNRLIRNIREIPFYKEYFGNGRSPTKITDFPRSTKKTLREAYSAGSCVNKKLEGLGISMCTSGSTGVPFCFLLDKTMLALNTASYRRLFSWIGKNDDDLVVRMMRFDKPGFDPSELFFFITEAKDLDQRKFQLYELFSSRTIILHSYMSYLIRLAQHLEKDKRKFKFKAVICSAEMLTDDIRTYLMKIFEAPIYNRYGATEMMRLIGHECEMHDGFHIAGEKLLVEVVDAKDKPVEKGVHGNILITFLDNYVMPLIRYEIGDTGYFMKELCPCGRTFPRIKIDGRLQSSFILPNGNIGDFTTLAYPLSREARKIKQYQIIRKSVKYFILKIVPTDQFNDSDKLNIMRFLKEYLGKASIEMKIVPESEIEILAGKPRAFINEVNDFRVS